MSDAGNFALWFFNNSNSSGNVCVYQDAANIVENSGGNLKTLAWMVHGSNPGGQIKFTWNTDYNFVWFDYDPPLSQGFKPATPGDQVTLSKNQFGYTFSPPVAGTDGRFSIKTDQSIPSVNQTVAGIGMHGAGTFAVAAQPNINSAFTPAQDGALAYWISFGCNYEVNQVIDMANLNPSGKVTFPYGMNTMTAVYNIDGTWTISQGKSSVTLTSNPENALVYNPQARAAAPPTGTAAPD